MGFSRQYCNIIFSLFLLIIIQKSAYNQIIATNINKRDTGTESTSPGNANIITKEIYFSHESGFYKNSFELELRIDDPDSQIYYTLNGSTPTTNSHLYSKPITIKNISQTPWSYSNLPTTPLEGEPQLYDFIWKQPHSVYKCNVVRFAAFKNGFLPGEIHTKTYFVDPNINKRYEFPIISLTTDSLSLFDYDTGIYIPGKRFDTNGFDWFPEGNYHNRGREWERLVHLSFFESNGNIAFETNAGIRMRGFGSASFPQKSINVYLRSEYGINKTTYPLFKNDQTKAYKRFIFRNAGNDFIYAHLRDAMMQQVMSTMDLEKQDFDPIILFINGEYWGIHNMREKYDKYYFKYKYGVDEDEINILEICGKIDEGDNKDYLDVISFVEHQDMTIAENYSFVKDHIDINNFIDFQIAEIFFANYDWPCNNYKIWKSNAPDSKWRFLIYDLDLGFAYNQSHSSYSMESMEHATSSSNAWPHCECSNILFRRLLLNEDFKELFLSRFAYHLNNTFKSDHIIKIINDFEMLFENEMEEHINRWHYPATYTDWIHELDILREFAEKRPAYMTKNLADYFDLTEFDIRYIDSVEDILLYPNPNTGHFALYNNTMEDVFHGNMTIINTSGQVVNKQYNISIFKDQPRYIKLQNLQKGAYLFIFDNNKEVIKKKIIITYK